MPMFVRLFSIFIFLLSGCSSMTRGIQIKSELVRVDPQPKKGFNYPYYVYIPKSKVANKKSTVPLIVIPNNTGTSTDDFSVHERRVIRDMERSSKDLAEEAGLPVLMPVFPRPVKDQAWKIYTHSLDRDTLLIKDGFLKRIDLQLVAMIDDARALLRERGLGLLNKFLISGYSASGTFANRFAFLHPELVLGVSSGGVNGIPTLPIAKLKKRSLPFPIGIADFESLIGKKFNFSLYSKIPQFIYMGAKDKNDTVPFRDAWSESEAKIIKSVLPIKMMPDRWEKTSAIYKSKNINAKFKTYEEYGHEYPHKIRKEVSIFFNSLY